MFPVCIASERGGLSLSPEGSCHSQLHSLRVLAHHGWATRRIKDAYRTPKKGEGTQDRSILHAPLPKYLSSHSNNLENKPLLRRPSGTFRTLTLAQRILCYDGLCSGDGHRTVRETAHDCAEWLQATRTHTQVLLSASISGPNCLSPVAGSPAAASGLALQLYTLVLRCSRRGLKTVCRHRATPRLAFHGRSEHTMEDI